MTHQVIASTMEGQEPETTRGEMTTDGPKVGSKIRCGKCGTEVVVVKAPATPIRCCGEALSAAPKKEAANG